MARIPPLSEDELPESVRPILEFATTTMGFTANDVTTMAAGCEYCVAHNAHGLMHDGVNPAKGEYEELGQRGGLTGVHE